MPELRPVCCLARALFLARLDCPGWVSVRHLSLQEPLWNSAATGRCSMEIKAAFLRCLGVPWPRRRSDGLLRAQCVWPVWPALPVEHREEQEACSTLVC